MELREAIAISWFNAAPPVSDNYDKKTAKKAEAKRRQILLRFRERVDRVEEKLMQYEFDKFGKEMGLPYGDLGASPLPEDFPYRETEPPDENGEVALRTFTLVLPPGVPFDLGPDLDEETLKQDAIDDANGPSWATQAQLDKLYRSDPSYRAYVDEYELTHAKPAQKPRARSRKRKRKTNEG